MGTVPRTISVAGVSNPHLARLLEDSHFTMQNAMRENQRRRQRGRGKGQGKTGPRGTTFSPDFIDYRGAPDTCSVCMDKFRHDEVVVRLQCNHLFHASCHEKSVTNSIQEEYKCPNCRGPPILTAKFLYAGYAPDERQLPAAGTNNASSSAGPWGQ